MIVRRDHVAGGALLALGVAVLALGAELPFGTPASPGPGMMPVLSVAFLMLFAVVLLVGAGSSPPLATIDWSDLPHALRVLLAAVAAAALYTTLGFLVTFSLLLFGLIYVVERMPLVPALAIGVGASCGAYVLLDTLLKTPQPRGIFGL